jgi:hypothetical protein
VSVAAGLLGRVVWIPSKNEHQPAELNASWQPPQAQSRKTVTGGKEHHENNRGQKPVSKLSFPFGL